MVPDRIVMYIHKLLDLYLLMWIFLLNCNACINANKLLIEGVTYGNIEKVNKAISNGANIAANPP